MILVMILVQILLMCVQLCARVYVTQITICIDDSQVQHKYMYIAYHTLHT